MSQFTQDTAEWHERQMAQDRIDQQLIELGIAHSDKHGINNAISTNKTTEPVAAGTVEILASQSNNVLRGKATRLFRNVRTRTRARAKA